MLKKAVEVSEQADGREHPLSWSIRLSYAEALLADPAASGSLPEVRSIVDEKLPDLPALHPFVIQHDRLRGLLAQRLGNRELARESLQKALDGAVVLYSRDHWRTKRLRSELAATSP